MNLRGFLLSTGGTCAAEQAGLDILCLEIIPKSTRVPWLQVCQGLPFEKKQAVPLSSQVAIVALCIRDMYHSVERAKSSGKGLFSPFHLDRVASLVLVA